CLKNGSAGDSGEHSLGHGEIDEGFGVLNFHLVVADQATGLDEPAEGALNDPSFRQNLEALHVVAALDDLQVDLAMAFHPRHLADEFPGIAAIRPDLLEPAVGGGENGQQQTGTIPVLHVGGRDPQREDEAEGVYQDVSLSSCNFLTRIKATKSGLASCANALAVDDRSGRGFFFPSLSRARSRMAW